MDMATRRDEFSYSILIIKKSSSTFPYLNVMAIKFVSSLPGNEYIFVPILVPIFLLSQYQLINFYKKNN